LILKLIEYIKIDLENIDSTVIHVIFNAGRHYQEQQQEKPTEKQTKTPNTNSSTEA